MGGGPRRLVPQQTRFFGREKELGELLSLVLETPLLSLVGAPGCGKTRLAVELGVRLDERVPGGAWFVGLAQVTEENVVGTIAAALAVGERPGRTAADGIVEVLASTAGRFLLVLDSCEHVTDVVGDLVLRMVDECPLARVLVTSRTLMGVPGERVWRLGPLDQEAATGLFVDRAGLASSRFHVAGADEVAAIQETCARLDGLPLAVELVAAWTRVLSLGQIVERLDRLAQLDQSASLLLRDRPPTGARQVTMKSTVDRSCQLLPDAARSLFARVSVFVGGFDLDAVAALSGSNGSNDSNGDVLAALTTLVDHSLVVAAGEVRGKMRYQVLEPVRQCAAARLAATGEAEAVRRRHALHYLALVDRLDPSGLRHVGSPVTLPDVAPDEGNLVAALEWARSQPGDLALRLCTAMATYWLAEGRLTNGRAQLDDLLAHGTSDPILHAAALEAAGSLSWRAGAYSEADRRLDQALAVAAQLGDPWAIGAVLVAKAKVAASAGEVDRARAASWAAIIVCERHHDATTRFWALVYLGWSHYIAAEPECGDQHMRTAAALDHRVDPTFATVTVLFGLQYGAFLAGNPVAHREHLRSARAALDGGGFGLQQEADWLASAAALAATEGRSYAAIRLLGAALRRLAHVGSQLPGTVVGPILARLQHTWDSVGQEMATRLCDQGAALSWPELVAQAIAEPAGQPGGRDTPLTRRELEVAVHVAQGMTNGQIAAALHVSRRTVESHLDNIRRKLGFTNRNQIMVWVLHELPDHLPS